VDGSTHQSTDLTVDEHVSELTALDLGSGVLGRPEWSGWRSEMLTPDRDPRGRAPSPEDGGGLKEIDHRLRSIRIVAALAGADHNPALAGAIRQARRTCRVVCNTRSVTVNLTRVHCARDVTESAVCVSEESVPAASLGLATGTGSIKVRSGDPASW
jgi:hypothetical protein